MNKLFVALICALALTGCIAPPMTLPYEMTTPFLASDFQPYVGAGPANLHGQAFMRTVGGDVKTCAGQEVDLMPDNSYDEEFVKGYSSGHTVINPDPRMSSFFRKAICDAQGNFTFTNIPAGSWYVDTAVTWGVPHIEQPGERVGPITGLLLGIPPPPSIDQQGGELRKLVTLQAGDNQVIITDADAPH